MFDFLKTEKNLERLSKAFYYIAAFAAICVIAGSILAFVTFFGLKMEYTETLTKELRLSETHVLQWYSIDPPQPHEQPNLNELFGLQTQTIIVKRK